jgi:hypothetical protein
VDFLEETAVRPIQTSSCWQFKTRAGIAFLTALLIVTVTASQAADRAAGNKAPKKSTKIATKGAPPSEAQLDLLLARLEAGEFGPAIDAAATIEEPARRTEYLKQIVGAEREAGEFQAADATASRIPIREERAATRGEIGRQRTALGGGVQADFNSLMNLMKNTIEPDSWDDLSGPGSVMPYRTGVYVDPNGLMRQLTKEETTGSLESLARRARAADINDDMARSSNLRLVSLKRLEKAVSERLESGRPVLETMQQLAGLTQIKYVFVYADEADGGEIVVAGPAEGWKYDDAGRSVGRESGRPMLQLDDFVVVLRTFAPGGQAEFGCSINTRDANLKQVKEFVDASNAAGPLAPGQLSRWLKELHNRLGLQDVVVTGVPANTRVAQVLVEADYRMKLVGVAKLDTGKLIPSYFDLLKAAGQTKGAPLEALRWWLTMKYAAIMHSPDRSFFEIQGSSVLVQSENQFVNSQGQHLPTGAAEPVNRLFAERFTQKYDELAQRDLVFADMRNIFDMALVAALCRQEELHQKADWSLGAFGPGGVYQPAVVNAPTVVESVMNHRVYGGKDIVVQVAGGVQADVVAIARDKNLAKEDAGLGKVAQRGKNPALPEGRWWWDAKE